SLLSTPLHVCATYQHFFLFFTSRPPHPPLFPYTTLFRSFAPTGMIRGFGMTPKGKAMLGLALAIVLLNALGLLVGALSIRNPNRSEEHTSELQSRSDLVCRLLLEKKNRRRLSTFIPTFNP